MSDYTPTTGEVHRRYAYARSGKPGHKNQSAVAEFDCWLAAHDAEVRASVLAEQGEPEWEYGYGANYPVLWTAPSQEQAEKWRGPGERTWKRTAAIPAGPWLPVEENGENA